MKKFLIFLILSLFTNICYSQDDLSSIFKVIEDTVAQEEIDSLMALVKPKYKWMGSEGEMVADSMKLKYRKPKGFRQDGTLECFKDYPNLRRTFSCIGIKAKVKDMEIANRSKGQSLIIHLTN